MRRALVRPPATSFPDGLTTAGLGRPFAALAAAQHEGYCRALEACGLELTRLPPDPRFPDSTFVEDAAILTERCAVLTRPGAPSRAGEVEAIRPAVAALGLPVSEIEAPGTLDGGDVCDADGRFLIGLSARTNEEGARSLAAILARHGYTSETLDVRAIPALLHLKTGLSYVGGGTFLAIEELRGHPALLGAEVLYAVPGEEYGANAIEVSGCILIPAGHPALERSLSARGREVLTLDVSEFRKMDGGLSCLSLRL